VVFVLPRILLARAVGAPGIGDSWPAAVRFGLAAMLLLTASAHFTTMKEDLVRMVPPWVPKPRATVYFTGVCELLGAIGLLLPGWHRIAGLALVVFFVAVLPANVHAARAAVPLRGRPATPLWLRVPMQVLFIGLAWWSTTR
jgi:uncharacterized membrane protein